MLLSEGLSKLNKKAAWDSGIKNSVSMQDQSTQYGELYSKNYRGLFMRTGTHFPGTCSARSELWPPPKGLIPLGGGGSSLI